MPKVNFWDGLIESIAKDALSDRLEAGSTLTEAEMVLRVMAKEDRFARRVLAKCLKDFLDVAVQKKAIPERE